MRAAPRIGPLLPALLILALAAPLQAQPYPGLAAGRPAPPFLLQDPQGKVHRLVDYRGRVTIVNFWASWCAPCREELPAMNRVWAELRNAPVAMLAINVSDDIEAIEAFERDHPIDFTVLLDSHGRIGRRWQVHGLPTTFVLDPYGRIAHRLVGKRDWNDSDLLQLVRRLMPAE
jgi:peroxiredoxin